MSEVIAGYACLFDRPDMAGDVIAPRAFRDSLARRGAGEVRLLFQHDPAQPLGVWLEIAEDARGLRVRGRLSEEVQRSRELLALIRAGAIDGLSIGFRTVRGQRDRATGLRRLEAIDLWEISLVTFPMQPEARIDTVKARRSEGGDGRLLQSIRRATLLVADPRAPRATQPQRTP